MLFPTLDPFLIDCVEPSLKGLAKLVSESADFTMEMTPKKAEMAVHEKTSHASEKESVRC